LQGPDKGRRFELPDAPTLIGRESRALPLTDNTVSRRHAELHPLTNGWVLKDLGSSNGTYVNGVRVENTYALKLGDQMRVGKTILVFGAHPGVSRANAANLSLSSEDTGRDASIMHTMPGNDDSMVLAVPEPAAAAMTNLKLLYQLGAALGSSFTALQVLEVVMDLVFEHVTADRGMVLLLDEKKNELVPKVVRVRDEEAERKPSGNGNGSRGDGKSSVGRRPPAATNGDDDSDKPIPVAPSDDEQAETGPPKFHASRTIVSHVLNS